MSTSMVESQTLPKALYKDVLIYSPAAKEFMFVSGDEDPPDRIVELKPSPTEERFLFDIIDAGLANGRQQVKFLCHHHDGEYLFVSDTTDKGDRIVEARLDMNEPRGTFELTEATHGTYYIYNRKTDCYLFASHHTQNRDRVVEASPEKKDDSKRSYFQFFALLSGPIKPMQ